jgi:tetratricopeptide (TPR) repeat protein
MRLERPCDSHKPYILGPRLEDILEALARLMKTSKHEEVIVDMEELLSLRKDIQGVSHDDTLECMTDLASAYQGVGMYDESEGHWKEVICLRIDIDAACEWDARSAIYSLGNLYMLMEREVEAELLYDYAGKKDVTASGFLNLLATEETSAKSCRKPISYSHFLRYLTSIP